jgi:hypothetical protein
MQDLGASLNDIACRAAAQRNQELFRMMFELISLREKVAQAKLIHIHRTHSRSFSSAANNGGIGNRQQSRRKSVK